ncbi:hypothetical protein C8F01DRAFT_1254162 [Mycena amicta]|nr:hypothetical protein C8F01DRAFT_1254162 [Mycena amicta]
MVRASTRPTVQLQNTARRTSSLKYDHSDHGRVVRRERVRSKRRISKKHLSRIRLPDLVEDWACGPLRTNYEVFEAAHTGADGFVEAEFSHWLQQPPFDLTKVASAEDPTDYDEFSNWYVSCAVDGCLLRREEEREARLKQDLAPLSKKKMEDELRLEVRRLLQEDWVDIQAVKDTYISGTREHTIYERHRIFVGRRIYRMYYLKFL